MAREHTVFVYTCTFLENGAMVRSGTPALSPGLYILRPLHREGGGTIWDPLQGQSEVEWALGRLISTAQAPPFR